MNTDLDFRQLIDADPTNWQNLCVYSDFLQERNDPRGLGFAALGQNRLVPWWFRGFHCWGFWDSDYASIVNWNAPGYPHKCNCLPYRWMYNIEENKHIKHSSGRCIYNLDKRGSSAFVLYRAVALAFTKLPPERQQQIMKGELE